MGNNIRTPKPHYFKHGVVVFYVIHKKVWFSVRIWTNDGLMEFEFEHGVYHNDVELIVSRALHYFSSVGVIEN